MKAVSKQFLDTLFDPYEEVCVSPDGYAYRSIPQEKINDSITLSSNNPKVRDKTITEDDIVLISMNPIKGLRNDDSVVTHRTFLIELDEGLLDEQRKYIEELGMPHSVCVFSGNKSLHYGIVLEKPLPHPSLWRSVNQWILNIVSKADQQTKNPSRGIRFPGNIRKDGKGLKQVLLSNKGRVRNEDLNVWLSKHLDKKPAEKKIKSHNGGIVHIGNVPKWVRDYWENGIDTERNQTWHNLACWFAEKDNYDFDRFIDVWEGRFNEEHDFTHKEWIAAIESAFKRVQGE